jgi:hypothetical protein
MGKLIDSQIGNAGEALSRRVRCCPPDANILRREQYAIILDETSKHSEVLSPSETLVTPAGTRSFN